MNSCDDGPTGVGDVGQALHHVLGDETVEARGRLVRRTEERPGKKSARAKEKRK